MAKPIRNKIGYRPTRFVNGIIGIAVARSRGNGTSAYSSRISGKSGAAFGAGAGGAGVHTDDPNGVQFWTVGIDPLDDSDYVLA